MGLRGRCPSRTLVVCFLPENVPIIGLTALYRGEKARNAAAHRCLTAASFALDDLLGSTRHLASASPRTLQVHFVRYSDVVVSAQAGLGFIHRWRKAAK